MHNNLQTEFIEKLLAFGDEDTKSLLTELFAEIKRFYDLSREAELQKLEVLISQYRGINDMLEQVLFPAVVSYKGDGDK